MKKHRGTPGALTAPKPGDWRKLMVADRFASPDGYEVRYHRGRLHGEAARRGWHGIDTDEVLALLSPASLLALKRGEVIHVTKLELSIIRRRS